MYRNNVALIVVLGVLVFAVSPVAPSWADATETYIVLHKKNLTRTDAAEVISEAGGTLVYNYDQIGVLIARSDSALFRDILLEDKRIQGVASTADFGVRLYDGVLTEEGANASSIDLSSMSTDDEPLWGLQWDMRQIGVLEAHEVTKGDGSVIVAIIDSGIDSTHVDLAPNLDFGRCVSCIGGVPDQDPAAWDDGFGHGTHVAGTVAAAENGIGIVGIAPDVKIAAIKGCGDDGYCWPENIICSFMWAGDHQIDVANNSYFVDPYEFNCLNDPEQRAIWTAVRRAVRYAQSRGVMVVSSAGNSNVDLTRPPGEVTNACNVLPVELPEVIGVSANGNLMQKSYYSNYGVSAIDVVAPGGDKRFQLTDEAVNGLVLSTIPADSVLATSFPGDVVEDCTVSPCATYMYLQGTSMASPHAAGVAALIISEYGRMPAQRVGAMLIQAADSVPCPAEFNPGPPFLWPAECQGGEGYNSFYGYGQVNAYNAVTQTSGNE